MGDAAKLSHDQTPEELHRLPLLDPTRQQQRPDRREDLPGRELTGSTLPTV